MLSSHGLNSSTSLCCRLEFSQTFEHNTWPGGFDSPIHVRRTEPQPSSRQGCLLSQYEQWVCLEIISTTFLCHCLLLLLCAGGGIFTASAGGMLAREGVYAPGSAGGMLHQTLQRLPQVILVKYVLQGCLTEY